METSSSEQTSSAPSKNRGPIIAASVIAVILLLVGGLAALVWWANGRDKPVATRAVEQFSRYRGPWESAMQKAGVEATFPGGPVDLEKVVPSGRQEFSATFTPEEVAALLAVYRYQTDDFGGQAALEEVEVDFPKENFASLSGRITLNGGSYQAAISAPLTFLSGQIVIAQGGAKLSVEGFSVGGERRTAALTTLSAYLNSMLAAAPGLVVEEAEVIEGSVRVRGTAPDRLEHPDPIPSSGSGAIALDDYRV
ncbi:MAG TPA: hypothetical protein VLA05_11085 [Coriobacteriia bacterium]|nr:hypothetical protein [Coriobacteriia bacterium]